MKKGGGREVGGGGGQLWVAKKRDLRHLSPR